MKRTRGIHYDWDASLWLWKPDVGPWETEHGRPLLPAYLEVSTETAAHGEAYAFWRDVVFYNFDADRLCKSEEASFYGHGKAVLTSDANFYAYRSAGVSGCRSIRQARAEGRDRFEIGVVLSGTRSYIGADNDVYIAHPGMFFVYDEARSCRIAWSDHEGLHISLPRASVEAALGRCVHPVTIAKALNASRFGSTLKDQLLLFARHMSRLSRQQRAVLLDQTRHVVLLALEDLAFAAKPQPSEQTKITLFLSAKRYIERHFTHFDLDVERVARALATSRASLYRAFAEQEITIAGLIREMRLLRARDLLKSAPAHITIQEIAARSGFIDIRTFNRAFQTRFGENPGAVRLVKEENVKE